MNGADKGVMNWISTVNRERREGAPDPTWLKLLRDAIPVVEKHAPGGPIQWPQHQKVEEQARGTTIVRKIAPRYEFWGQPLVPVLVSTGNTPLRWPQEPAAVPAGAGDAGGSGA